MQVRETTDSFTRPGDTTAYADGDLVANSTTAGSVIPLNWNVGIGGGQIVGVRVEKTDGTDVSNADFTLRLFSESPTVANGDNGAISHDVSGHLYTLDVGQMVAGTDDAYVNIWWGATGFTEALYIPNGQLYGLLEANAAYGPANAEVFTVTLIYVK